MGKKTFKGVADFEMVVEGRAKRPRLCGFMKCEDGKDIPWSEIESLMAGLKGRKVKITIDFPVEISLDKKEPVRKTKFHLCAKDQGTMVDAVNYMAQSLEAGYTMREMLSWLGERGAKMDDLGSVMVSEELFDEFNAKFGDGECVHRWQYTDPMDKEETRHRVCMRCDQFEMRCDGEYVKVNREEAKR